MKQGRNTSITRNNAGEVVAINLGVDYYFEHEHGIAPLNECLSIVDRKISKGVHLIATNLNTPGFVYVYKGVRYNLWGLSANYTDNIAYWRHKLQREYFNLEREPICSFWDRRSFFFMTEDKKLIEDFYKAFTENDIKIWVRQVFSPGLVIAIQSRLSQFNKNSGHQLEKYGLGNSVNYNEKVHSANQLIEEYNDGLLLVPTDERAKYLNSLHKTVNTLLT